MDMKKPIQGPPNKGATISQVINLSITWLLCTDTVGLND